MTCGRACGETTGGDAPFLGNDQPPTVQPHSAFTTLFIHRALATNFEICYRRSDEVLKLWNWKVETVVDPCAPGYQYSRCHLPEGINRGALSLQQTSLPLLTSFMKATKYS